MHVHPGMPPYTDTRQDEARFASGKDCQPLTGALRRRLLEESREGDLTATTIDVPTAEWLAASASEALREAASREDAPDDLLELGNEDLLDAMGVLHDGRPTLAALLLAGSPAAIREHVPNYDWTHLRMASDTEYSDRMDGNDAIPVALGRIVDRIMADNPIETVRSRLHHFEYRTYPEVALREALLNAFCHANYRIASPILVKQYADHIEITNPGGLLGGITPDNILHHDPVTRNHCLVGALARLRLVNRSNLGVRRIYKSLLIEGKAPPNLRDLGDAVRITLRASRISPAFRNFVAEEASKGIVHSVDELLLFRHLLREWVVGTPVAAKVCQRTPDEVREILFRMEAREYLDGQGRGRDAYWTLPPTVYDRLSDREGRERKARNDPQTDEDESSRSSSRACGGRLGAASERGSAPHHGTRPAAGRSPDPKAQGGGTGNDRRARKRGEVRLHRISGNEVSGGMLDVRLNKMYQETASKLFCDTFNAPMLEKCVTNIVSSNWMTHSSAHLCAMPTCVWKELLDRVPARMTPNLTRYRPRSRRAAPICGGYE